MLFQVPRSTLLICKNEDINRSYRWGGIAALKGVVASDRSCFFSLLLIINSILDEKEISPPFMDLAPHLSALREGEVQSRRFELK